jgi:polyketide biosynthesis enoyl-CoA hydratase PksH
MTHQTVSISRDHDDAVMRLRMDRPGAQNSLNRQLIRELRERLAEAEEDARLRVIVLEGTPEHFCTGMDFHEVATSAAPRDHAGDGESYFDLLAALSGSARVVIARVEGQANAGGVGLAAASDLVIAGEQATFSLSEALFGLLPACLLPFLVRRVGLQHAHWLTLSTLPIGARRAQEIGLADDVGPDATQLLQRYLARCVRLDPRTVRAHKSYLHGFAPIGADRRAAAIDQLRQRLEDATVQENIRRYVLQGTLPWQTPW